MLIYLYDARVGGVILPCACAAHIEWTVAGIIGTAVNMPWTGQPAAPGSLRAELTFRARPGAAAAITSALAAWRRLRFEVTEEASPGCDGVRYSYTPALGTFTAVTGANDDIFVPEGRLRAAIRRPWQAARSTRS